MGATGAGLLWCWWRIRGLGDVRLHLGAFYADFAAAFALYLLTLWLIGRSERASQHRAHTTWTVGIIVVVAVAARLFLLGTAPTLSDDIYRYRWDGRVQQAGLDPYAYPPEHPALAPLRDAEFARINFPQLRTVYPPLTQLAFRLGVAIGPTLTAQKLVFVSAELLTFLSLLFILWRRRLALAWVAAYAWHPLVILEVAGSGHNDVVGLAWLWLGLAAWEARRWPGAALSWSAAFLSKFTSVILGPWWWFRRQARRWLIVCVLLSAAPLVVHPSTISALHESLSAMTTRFESNASLFLLAAWMIGNPSAARYLITGAWALFLVWWSWRQADPVKYLLGALGTAALLSPVLHPWYLIWLIPCFCFWRVPAFMALTGTVVLAYTVWPGRLADGRWVIPLWAHVLEYVPVALLGAWELRRCAWGSSHHLPASLQATVASRRAPSAHRQVVGIIIPARNEAGALGAVLAEIPLGVVHQVIVVDNGSSDGTADVARAGGADVVSEPRAGYGRACLAGLSALEPSIETVVFMDGDHSDYPEELPRLIEPIAQGRAELVIGSRIARAQPGSLTLPQRVGNRLACALMRRCFGVRYTDLGPFRAIRRDALARLAMADQAFGWTVEMQAKAAKMGLAIEEVPVRYRPRIGRSKISGTLTGTLRAGSAILSTIARVAWSRAPRLVPIRCADSSSS